jgi:hypothetical protein
MTHRKEATLGLGVIVAMVVGLTVLVVTHFPTPATQNVTPVSPTKGRPQTGPQNVTPLPPSPNSAQSPPQNATPLPPQNATQPSSQNMTRPPSQNTQQTVSPGDAAPSPMAETVQVGAYTLRFTEDALRSLRPMRFTVRPSRPVKQVTIAGGFNGWNTTATPLTRTGKDWHVTLWLPQGKHNFKYVYDGTDWVLDPQWPTVSDSAGHTNSVVTVAARADLPFLTLGLAGAPGKHILVDVGRQREWLESTIVRDGKTARRAEILSGTPERRWGRWETR